MGNIEHWAIRVCPKCGAIAPPYGEDERPSPMSTLYSVVSLPAVLQFGVADPNGNVIETYPKRGRALERVAELNGKLREQREHVERFYAGQAREFIRRTS